MSRYFPIVGLILVVLAAQTLAVALRYSHQKDVPQLSGSTYKIVSPNLSQSEARLDIADNQLKWSQCNTFVCQFKQNGDEVRIKNCTKVSSSPCQDEEQERQESEIQNALAKTRHLQVYETVAYLKDKKNNLLLSLTKV